MSDVTPEPGSIIELIERDHEVIGGMLDRFAVSGTDEWGRLFMELVEYMVRHEVAEEEVVYKRLRAAMPGSEKVVAECTAEEERAERHLAAMERLSPRAPEFKDALGHLRDEIRAHIAHEEQVVVPLIRSLRAHDDPELARRYEVARTVAPSRPEPVGEGEPAERGGPLGSLAHLAGRLRAALHTGS